LQEDIEKNQNHIHKMEDIFNDPSYIHLKDISFKKAVQTLHDELHNLDLEVE